MMNGTRCNSCGNFVYARRIPGAIDPDDFNCVDCEESGVGEPSHQVESYKLYNKFELTR